MTREQLLKQIEGFAEHREPYLNSLRKAISSASEDALAICQAWHDDKFGLPGWGSGAWVAQELQKAEQAAEVMRGAEEKFTTELATKVAQSASVKLAAKLTETEKRVEELEAAEAHREKARDGAYKAMCYLEKLLPHLVDVVWGEAHEDQSVPSSDWAHRMIEKAKASFHTPCTSFCRHPFPHEGECEPMEGR